MLLEDGGESCLHSLLRLEYLHPEYSNNVLEIARLLVGAGCDPAALNDSGLSPIHLALSEEMEEVFRLLLENGCEIDCQNHRGETPLHIAAREGEPIDEALFLLENGCDVHATGSSGVTVLGTAIENGYRSIAKILLDR
ncbi:ankyrin repeat protein, partial [Melanogaster broomeanus]